LSFFKNQLMKLFQYDLAEKADKIPMGETVRYASYVMSPGCLMR
jgi:hypothetical protein